MEKGFLWKLIISLKKKNEKLEKVKVGEKELTLNLIEITMTEYLKNLKKLRYITNKNGYRRIDFLEDTIRITEVSGKPWIGETVKYPNFYKGLDIHLNWEANIIFVLKQYV